VHSLAGLRELAGPPLVAVRCRHDGRLSAAVWRTTGGPLLVTGHRPALRPDRQVEGVPGAGTMIWGVSTWDGPAGWAGSRVWTPRLVLLWEDPADAFPVACPDCQAPMPYGVEQLAADVTRALADQPVTRAV